MRSERDETYEKATLEAAALILKSIGQDLGQLTDCELTEFISDVSALYQNPVCHALTYAISDLHEALLNELERRTVRVSEEATHAQIYEAIARRREDLEI